VLKKVKISASLSHKSCTVGEMTVRKFLCTELNFQVTAGISDHFEGSTYRTISFYEVVNYHGVRTKTWI
jgi:hypothetical protein